MMEEKDIVIEDHSVYSLLLRDAYTFFKEHPIMLYGVGLSALSTCVIMGTCIIIENKKGVN